jgi:methionine-rich copper-binding protein CopC
MNTIRRDRVVGRRAGRRILAGAVGLLIVLSIPALALAHAELVSSTPAADAVITEVPAEIVLTFDEAVVGTSSFSVLDVNGATVVSGGRDPENPTIMRAPLPDLAAGPYTVQWTSVAADTDVERGTFTFHVAVASPPTPTDTPEPTVTVTDNPTILPSEAPTPSPSPSASSDGTGSGGTDVIFPIVAAVILIGGGLAYFMRRRGPA